MRVSRPPWRTIVDAPSLHRALRMSALGEERPIVVLDCRHRLVEPDWGARAFREGHVAGAQHAHVDRDLSAPPRPGTGRHPLPDVDAFRETCAQWGIDETTQVVAYDDAGGIWASRAWWLLRYYGHVDAAVLDGGLPAWKAEGFPLATDTPSPRRRSFKGHPGAMPTVTTWELTTRAPRCLVDARAPVRYAGKEEPVDPVAGHIPGALNVPTSANLDEQGRFLDAKALREKYERALGGLPPSEAAFYCGSGVTAPHDILAMHIAGLPGAALYPGSWSEWIRNPMRPVEKE